VRTITFGEAMGQQVRTDLSGTLFLNDPDDYDGGELTIEGMHGEPRIKLPAGDLVLYSATSVHRVEPVTRGERLASFFWLQSMVRDDGRRQLLHDMDMNLMTLRRQHGDAESVVALTGTYHNLLRMWAEV
jgi:PKHD-type hydroxylase